MTGFNYNDPCDSFVILTQPRCGSTVLRSMLASTRRIKCSYEGVIDNDGYVRIGADWHYWGEKKLLATKIRSLYKDHQKSTASFGVVLKAVAKLHDLEWIRYTCLRGNVKVLHLVRPLHEQLVSRLVALKTGIWFLEKDAKPNEIGSECSAQFEISRSLADKACRSMVGIDVSFACLANISPYSRLAYSSACNMFNKAYQQLTGNPAIPFVDPKYRRTIEGDHRYFVSNWNEIADIFDFWETKRDYIFKSH